MYILAFTTSPNNFVKPVSPFISPFSITSEFSLDEVIDLEGRLALPPYVDPHLIFSGLGEGNAIVSGTLFEGK